MDLVIGAVLISNKILIEGERPAWMYRENPIGVEDSGWRVFSGNEDDSYLENPHNFKTISANQLITFDDSLKANLFAPVGSSFERAPDLNKRNVVDKG